MSLIISKIALTVPLVQEAVDSVLVWVDEKQVVLKDYATIPLDREKLDRMLGEHVSTHTGDIPLVKGRPSHTPH